MSKRMLSMLLVCVMIFGMLPVVTLAAEDELVFGSAVYVNPIYADVVDEMALELFSQPMQQYYSAEQTDGKTTRYTSPEEVTSILREALESRTMVIQIPYVIPAESVESDQAVLALGKSMMDPAFAHTGVPTQGDYLQWQYLYWQIGISGSWNKDLTAVNGTVTFTVYYYTDADQEAAVTSRVDSLLAELHPSGTDYEKIKTVYDWMCNHIEYDYDNLGNPNYYLQYTAYAALINGTSVCQGYANLLYRLALELGIDCRIITGWSNSQNHAWNIVKLGDSYYNLDATWDTSYTQVGRDYEYFLRSDATFDDHVRMSDYTSSSFYAAYPMGESDYDPSQDAVEDENIIASGTCGENLTWMLDKEGTLTISGTGDMENYREGYKQTDSPWYEYRDAVTNVVIENGVTTIGSYAFCDCTNLANVMIGNGVTSIGRWAFSSCCSLTSIVLPDSVTSVDGYAFSYCSSLTSITIPESVTDIQDCAFQSCSSLTNITIPEGITWIGKSLFSNCDSLTSITIPTSVEFICYSAFSSCDSLTSIVIPENMAIVENWAFAECTSLNEITFLGDAPEIGEEVFLEVTATAYYPANNSTWTADVMRNYGGNITWTPVGGEPDVDENIIASGTCDEDLTWKLDADGKLTISGAGLMDDFMRNSTPWDEWREVIKSVVIEDGVTSIGALAFRDCLNLESVEIADSVTEIGSHVFSQCKSLTEIEIPDSVTSLGIGAFEHSGITNISLSNNLEIIDQGTFNACKNLKSIVIPEGVISFEKGAFWDCVNLESIVLPSSLRVIGHEVFYGCASLKEVTIPDGVTEIGGWAFENSGLTSIKIPASVTQIWEGAFSNCVDLTGIWVDEENENYSSDASGALLDKEQKTLLQVPTGLSGKYEIPNGVTKIERLAIYNCEKLTEVIIPDSVTEISPEAFARCSELVRIAIPNSVTEIADYTFIGCSALSSVVIPASVTTIGKSAFDDCDALWHVLYTGTEDQWNAVTIDKNNTKLKKATRHYNAVGDEIIAVDKTTCTEKIFCECTICGAVLAETIEGGTHDLTDWIITEATCTEDGIKSRTCSKCDFTETEVITAPGHDYQEVVTAPTCTEGGYTTYTCHCGDSYAEPIAALGHDEVSHEAKAPTCTEIGWDAYVTCSRCDYSTYAEKAATGHKHEVIVTAPTCTEAGYTTHTCPCGDTYVDGERAALGHEYACAMDKVPTTDVEGALRVRCRNCDLKNTVVLPKLNKTDYAYEVIKESTTEETGTARYTWNVTEYGEHSFEVELDKLPAFTLGDVNGDDKITVLDLMRLANFFAGKDVEISEAAADVNGDGKVTVLDLMRLANYFAGKAQLG